MSSVSFLILVDSFSLHHSIFFFLQILYDTTGKLNEWCGGSKNKNKPVWKTTISFITQTTTRGSNIFIWTFAKKRKEVHEQCAEEVQAFRIRLRSSPSFSSYLLSQFGIKLPVIFPSFLFSLFSSSSLFFTESSCFYSQGRIHRRVPCEDGIS
jgi:hypothetical protein